MKGEPFKAADIRRTAETQLAALKISKDVKTEPLSLGRNSLIAGRFHHHQYLDDKRQVLEEWEVALKKVWANAVKLKKFRRLRNVRASADCNRYVQPHVLSRRDAYPDLTLDFESLDRRSRGGVRGAEGAIVVGCFAMAASQQRLL
jgi:hypothetical protein